MRQEPTVLGPQNIDQEIKVLRCYELEQAGQELPRVDHFSC